MISNAKLKLSVKMHRNNLTYLMNTKNRPAEPKARKESKRSTRNTTIFKKDLQLQTNI